MLRRILLLAIADFCKRSNGLGYQGGSMAELSAYKDAAAIPKYARPGITAARAANIVVNYPALDQIRPIAQRPALRWRLLSIRRWSKMVGRNLWQQLVLGGIKRL